jgi:hypothetical protein
VRSPFAGEQFVADDLDEIEVFDLARVSGTSSPYSNPMHNGMVSPFPVDFMFTLNETEFRNLQSQTVAVFRRR